MASSQGPNSGGTFADDAGVGVFSWSNPGNAAASDNSYATVSLFPTGQSHYLKATNFGFSIPGGSTIEGIVVEVEHKESGSGVCRDNRIRIVKGGAIGSTDKASGTEWPTSDGTASYGADNDLWGETWTVSEINASDFGVAISAIGLGTGTASIDHIKITVYYS